MMNAGSDLRLMNDSQTYVLEKPGVWYAPSRLKILDFNRT